MGNVNQFEQPKQVPLLNAIDAIAGALKAAHSYYGIDTEKAQGRLAELRAKQEQERQDPNSPASKLAQSESSSILDFAKKNGIPVDDKIKSTIAGTPGTIATEYPGYPGPAITTQTGGTPGMSAAQIDADRESGGVSKLLGEVLAAKSRENMFNFRDAQLDKRQQFSESKMAQQIANKDPELVTSQNRLNGLSRISDIIKKVESGELKGTTQIQNSIANEYAKLEAGSNSAGLGQSERASMVKTLQADANDLWTRISGHIAPDGSISPDQMKQLKGEIGTMGESYMQQFDQRHQALREGFQYPESQQALDTKVNSIRSSFSKRLGGWSGLKPDGSPAQTAPAAGAGAPTAAAQPHPMDSVAVQWAKSNPNDPRAVKILQLNGG